MVELVADVPDVAGRLTEDLGQLLAPDALVRFAVLVGRLAPREAVVLLLGRAV